MIYWRILSGCPKTSTWTKNTTYNATKRRKQTAPSSHRRSHHNAFPNHFQPLQLHLAKHGSLNRDIYPKAVQAFSGFPLTYHFACDGVERHGFFIFLFIHWHSLLELHTSTTGVQSGLSGLFIFFFCKGMMVLGWTMRGRERFVAGIWRNGLLRKREQTCGVDYGTYTVDVYV